MQKITTTTALILGTFLPFLAKAQCTVNGKEVPCDQFWASFGWLFIGLGVVVVALIAFWFWMLVHMIKNDIPNKVMWIVLMFIFQGPVAIIYYFAVKRKMDNQGLFASNINYSQPMQNDQVMPNTQSMPNDQVGGACSACGNSTTPEMTFCGKCGNKLK